MYLPIRFGVVCLQGLLEQHLLPITHEVGLLLLLQVEYWAVVREALGRRKASGEDRLAVAHHRSRV